MSPAPKVVFISHSHDNQGHADRVRGLAASLLRDGCDCRLDVHKDGDEDWPSWMTRQLLEADIVLCVITETYHRRFRDKEVPTAGLGVGWEAGLIRRLLYFEKLHNDRIFTVFFDPADRQYIPIELTGYDEFPLNDQLGYEPLLRKVLNVPMHLRPDIGPPPKLASISTAPLFNRPADSEPSTTPTTPAELWPDREGLARSADTGDCYAQLHAICTRGKELRSEDRKALWQAVRKNRPSSFLAWQLAVARMGAYKYSTANRAHGYEPHLYRTAQLPNAAGNGWHKDMHAIGWEEAVRAWRIVQATVFAQIAIVAKE